MSNPKDLLTKEYLEEHYIRQKKSHRQIAKELSIASVHSVCQYIKKFGLRRDSKRGNNKYLTKDYLAEHYIKQKKGTRQISAELGVSRESVKNALRYHNIPFNKTGTNRNGRWLDACKNRRGAFQEIAAHYWHSVIYNADVRELAFELTIEYAWDLYLAQNRVCAISGLPIRFYQPAEKPRCQTASLDRIDSNKGYIKGNVQWVHKDVQRMKWAFSQEYFIGLCTTIAKNQSNDNNILQK